MSSTEVTFGQIALFCYDNNQAPNLETFHEKSWGEMEANRPAVNVTWFDAIRYCNWLSIQAGYTNLAYDIYKFEGPVELTPDGPEGSTEVLLTPKDKEYWAEEAQKYYHWSSIQFDSTSKAYRLPIEAEWEYAASGYGKLGRKQMYPGTDSINMLGEYAWYTQNSSNRAQKVKGKLPNPHGIFDMVGNVWEWCFDTDFDDVSSYTGKKDPFCNGETGSDRMVRGGSWDDFDEDCSILNRYNDGITYYPDYRYSFYGFRLVRTR